MCVLNETRRSGQFPFTSIEADVRKSLCVATRDKNYREYMSWNVLNAYNMESAVSGTETRPAAACRSVTTLTE